LVERSAGRFCLLDGIFREGRVAVYQANVIPV